VAAHVEEEKRVRANAARQLLSFIGSFSLFSSGFKQQKIKREYKNVQRGIYGDAENPDRGRGGKRRDRYEGMHGKT